MKEKDYYFVKDGERVKVGDYFYNDGSLSHERIAEKSCIGVVFSTQVMPTEKFQNGYVVSLQDLKVYHREFMSNSLFVWKRVNDKDTQRRAILPEWKNDFGGYFYTYGEGEKDDTYEAINAVKKFDVELPSNTSKWYIPSSGQMYRIAQKFYKSQSFLNQSDLLNLSDKYMVSQLSNTIIPLVFCLSNGELAYEAINSKHLIRPVFTF